MKTLKPPPAVRPARPTAARRPAAATNGDDLRAVMEVWWRQHTAMAADTSSFFMELDLTMAQFRALAVIHHLGKQTGRDLAAHLGVTPGTLVPLADRLETLGYLRRVPDPQDRRLTWLELTPKGDRLFNRLVGVGRQRLMNAVAELSREDRQTLKRLLGRIADAIEAQRAEPGRDRARRLSHAAHDAPAV